MGVINTNEYKGIFCDNENILYHDYGGSYTSVYSY